VIGKALSSLSSHAVVGVLGSTVEFRDLLAQHQVQTVVFEKSAAFHTSIEDQRRYRGVEHVVWGDWLNTLSQWRGRLDAILSDLTSGNICYQDRESFYDLIYCALRPGGLFVDRVLKSPERPLRLSELDQKYVHRSLSLETLNEFSAEYLFLSELVEDAQVVDSTRFYEILQSRSTHTHLVRLARCCELITPRGFMWYYGKPLTQPETTFGVPFRVVTEIPESPPSVYSGHAVQYVLEKPG